MSISCCPFLILLEYLYFQLLLLLLCLPSVKMQDYALRSLFSELCFFLNPAGRSFRTLPRHPILGFPYQAAFSPSQLSSLPCLSMTSGLSDKGQCQSLLELCQGHRLLLRNPSLLYPMAFALWRLPRLPASIL